MLAALIIAALSYIMSTTYTLRTTLNHLQAYPVTIQYLCTWCVRQAQYMNQSPTAAYIPPNRPTLILPHRPLMVGPIQPPADPQPVLQIFEWPY